MRVHVPLNAFEFLAGHAVAALNNEVGFWRFRNAIDAGRIAQQEPPFRVPASPSE